MGDVDTDNDQPPSWRKIFLKKPPAESKKERETSLETAYEAAGFGGKPTVKGMAEYMGVTEKTVRIT